MHDWALERRPIAHPIFEMAGIRKRGRPKSCCWWRTKPEPRFNWA